MKVKHALELLNQLPKNEEICAQWFTKEDMEKYPDTLSKQVWLEANRLFDKWEETDMYYALEEAIYQAQNNLKKGKK